uniref:Uncharacterized protein LOC111119891 n=1 Tax=Crassostrea virginica TaxID=6565 RepID=A0A8B8CK03_CRAVI|nr:uncharacterized protein LOC111119891 [Crassostrea virginica]
MFISLVNYKKNVLVSTILAMTLYVPALRCYAQQCQTTNMKVIAKGGRPANDFKSIFTMEDKTFGLLFHKCFRRCEMNEQCIGLEICKMSEEVFRCQACCKWKKRRDYGFSAGSSDCTYYEQHIDFGTNLALHKNATLSAEIDSIHIESNAVDGITTCHDVSLVAATTRSANSWLLVDLGGVYQIRMVAVYARLDYVDQADNIFVVVNGENSNYDCGGEYPGPTESADVILFLCVSGSRGRSVTIFKTITSILGVCEVEVYGY